MKKTINARIPTIPISNIIIKAFLALFRFLLPIGYLSIVLTNHSNNKYTTTNGMANQIPNIRIPTTKNSRAVNEMNPIIIPDVFFGFMFA